MYTSGAATTAYPMTSVYTQGIGWMSEQISTSTPVSATYETASRAVYYPIILEAPCVARRVWWANGATVAGGATIEVGIYADSGSYTPGAKLVSGSATQGNANEVQFVDITDTAIPPGLYWIAVVSNSATNTTLFRSDDTGVTAYALRFQQASASPLPATATPVKSTDTPIWLCGFSTTASP